MCYFVLTLPRRFRRHREYRAAPKQIVFRLLTSSRMSVNQASGLIDLLQREEQGHLLPRQSTWHERLEALWGEHMSPLWKIPHVGELESIREELCAHIVTTPFGFFPREEILIWAVDDCWKTFVGYCPFTGQTTRTHPRRVMHSVVHGEPPDSCEKHYIYVVSVTPLFVQ